MPCPKCLQVCFVVYLDEDTGIQHRAKCDHCGYEAVSRNGRLVALVTA